MFNVQINNDEQVAAASLLQLLSSGVTDERSSQQEQEDSSNDDHHSDSSSSECSSLTKISNEQMPPVEEVLLSESTSENEDRTTRRRSYPLTVDTVDVSLPSSTTKKRKTPSGCRMKKVPEALMELLTSGQHQDLICFLPDDKKFLIANTKKFSEVIMGKYFKMSKFGCFLNRLSKFGFTHAALSNDQHLFFHPLFHRSDWVSLQQIRYRPMKTEITTEGVSNDLTRKRKIEHCTNLEATCKEPPISKVLRLEKTNLDGALPSIASQSDIQREMMENYYFSTRPSSRGQSPYSLSSSGVSSSFLSYDEACPPPPPPFSVMPLSSRGRRTSTMIASDLMQFATKDVVTRAIDCLLYDESHTLDLLARRGKEVHCRRLSLPPFSGQQIE